KETARSQVENLSPRFRVITDVAIPRRELHTLRSIERISEDAFHLAIPLPDLNRVFDKNRPAGRVHYGLTEATTGRNGYLSSDQSPVPPGSLIHVPDNAGKVIHETAVGAVKVGLERRRQPVVAKHIAPGKCGAPSNHRTEAAGTDGHFC